MLTSINKIIQFVKTYGQHLPLAFNALFSMPCGVIQLHGVLRGGTEQVTVLYVGRRKNYAYLTEIMFEEFRVIKKINSSLLTFRKYLATLRKSSDVIVLDIGWPYHNWINRKDEYLELPDWINMAIELQGNWKSVVQNFRNTTRNNDLRLIRRHGYRCELTRDRLSIEYFYDHMYLPFVRRKHSASSVVAPRRHVIRRALKGQLLQVIGVNGMVAAGVVYPEDGVLYFLWMGVPEEQIEKPAEGAVSALYLFGIRHAFDLGLAAVDFTGTRAFLSDGAFRFKRKWGAAVDDTFSPNSILLYPRNNLNAAKFFERIPVIARRDDGLEFLFLTTDTEFAEEDFRRIDSQYVCDGVDQVTVVQISMHNDSQLVEFDGARCNNRLVTSRLESFTEHFKRQRAVISRSAHE